MSVSFPFGNLEIAYTSNPNFSNAVYGDLMLYTGNNTQSVHIGVNRGAAAELDVSNSNVTVNGTLNVTGALRQNGGFMFRNRIINGDMRIDQRSNGAAVVAPSNVIPAPYIIDRVQIAYVSSPGVRLTVGQSNIATVLGNQYFQKAYYARVSTHSSGAIASTDYYHLFQQIIEGYNIADLAWGTLAAQPVTVSFWAYSTVSTVYNVVIRGNSITYPVAFTPTPNTWQYWSFTIPGCTTGTWSTSNTSGFSLLVTTAMGSTYTGVANTWNAANTPGVTGVQTNTFYTTSNNTFLITGVQLERGTVATPFEFRSYGTELALCQRYYVRYGSPMDTTTWGRMPGFGTCTNTNYGLFQFNVPVPLRNPSTVSMTTSGAGTLRVVNSSAPSGAVVAGDLNFDIATPYSINTAVSATMTLGGAFQLAKASNWSFVEFANEL